MLAMFDLCRLPNVVFSKPYPSNGKAAERARERSLLCIPNTRRFGAVQTTTNCRGRLIPLQLL